MNVDLENFSQKYLSILKNELSGINLTRIVNESDFFIKQVLDSVLPLEKSKLFSSLISKKNALLIDVGFGGGFPLVPLAYVKNKCCFIGIESKNKKVKAVELIISKMGINNISLFHNQIEDFNIDCPAVITFKAVGSISDLLKKIHCSNADVFVYFYKGPELEQKEDLSQIPDKWKKIDDISYELPKLGRRRLLGFQLTNVPRRTSNNNLLVKVSELPVNY